MTIDVKDKAEVEKQLWKEIEHGRFGMLGPVGCEVVQHFQPMTAFAEPESGKIWFYTNSETDLARAAEPGVQAMFTVISRDRDLQACISGDLALRWDSLHRDKYWNATVAAWFPKGKDDPHLALLCLTCHEAQVWLTQDGPVKFGWEIAKANLTGTVPDLGGKATLKLG
jgi:general stress protein 26